MFISPTKTNRCTGVKCAFGSVFTYNRQCGELVPEKQKIHCEVESLPTEEEYHIISHFIMNTISSAF